MKVRTATPEDVQRMLELVLAAPTSAQWSEGQFTKMFGGGEAARIVLVAEAEAGAESQNASSEKQISRFARNDNTYGNVDGYGEKNVRPNARPYIEGFVVAHLIGAECEIENVVVNPQSQRRGLGKILLEELLKRVQHAGCRAVFLEVRETNRAARGLYEKCGFREVGRRVKYYSQPEEDAVVYRFIPSADASETVQT
jgi:ribosomal-protein-alanine acetyltransferase